MASITTLRPQGTWDSNQISVIGATGSPSLALSDNSDSSWVQHFFSSGASWVTADLTNINLAANQRCARVRAGVRYDTGVGTTDYYLQIYRGATGSHFNSAHFTPETFPKATKFGNWTTVEPGTGAEWTTARINDVRLRLLDNAGGTTMANAYEAYFECDVRTRPTVSIVSPAAGALVYTRRPTVTWSYNAQGDTVRAHQMKVFTAAQVAAGGFNPDSTTPVWDTGRVNGVATSKQVGIDLARGTTYHAYVKLATDFNGADWWSLWSSRSFVINTLPVASAVTVDPPTPITTTNRPTIGWTYADANSDPQNQYWVRVYSEAVYGAPGFNEGDVASAAWSSGAVTSSAARTAQTGALSPNVNYKAFVWVTDAEGVWSASAQSGVFVIETAPGTMADPPAVPAIVSAEADNENLRAVLQVHGQDNMLTRNQSTIDTGVTGWEADANVALARDTATWLQGGGSLRMTASGSGAMRARTVGTDQLPVQAGRVYTGLASFRAAATARSVRVLLRWYDLADALVDTTTGASVADGTGGWTQAVATAAAPAGAVSVQLVVEVLAAAGGEQHFADNLSVAPGDETTWHRGGFVVEAGTLADGFDRADSAVSLGTADEGGAWTAHSGTWGVTAGRAYLAAAASPTDAVATVESTHLADGYVEADVQLSPGRANAGLVFRAVDHNTFLMARLHKTATTDTIQVYQRIAGTYTLLAEAAPAGLVLGTTYRLRVEFYGGQMFVHLDGQLRVSHLLLSGAHNTFGSNRRYGLYVGYHDTSTTYDDGASRWDNLRAALDPTQTASLERSDDDGATWAPVRGGSDLVLPGQSLTVYDYEVAPGVEALYRARVHVSEHEAELDSAWSAEALLSPPLVVTSWWLKNPLDPSVNQRIKLVPPFDFVRKEPQQVYEPLGRETAVVVTDGPRGIEGTLTLWAKDRAAYEALEAMLRLGHALLLIDPFGRQWYVKVGSTHEWSMLRAQPRADESTPTRHLHTVTVHFTEVAAPT